MLSNELNTCLWAHDALFITEEIPLPTLESVEHGTNETRENHITRESREYPRFPRGSSLPFHHDSSKTPADWIGIIVILLWTKGELKYIWAHFPVPIPVGSCEQPVHLTCVWIDVLFEPSVMKKKKVVYGLPPADFISLSRYGIGTSLQLRICSQSYK